MMSTASLVSCNNEELFIEPEAELLDEPTEVEEEPEDTEETGGEETAVDTSLPCDFNLDNVAPNSTIIIDCVLDLGGAVINLPENVTFVYEGGDIINGTLNFSDGGNFDPGFLNPSIAIAGTPPAMKDPVFTLIPERWGIVEGVVSDDVARNNRDLIEEIFFKLHDFGISTVKIDAMDAYFKVDGIFNKTVPQDEAINVPSNFNLEMTDNTHLRVQPNNYKNTVLFSVFNVSNVTINGGVFHGDRDEHDYSSGGTHEWGHLVLIKACNNVVFKNATLMDAGGDAIDINALGHSHDAFYTRAYNVLITGNTMIRSRRNHLSITDGYDIIVENNEFIDCSIHTSGSQGVAPGYAIDVEAVRPSEEAEDILVRNNIERGSRVGAFTVHTGNRVTFDGNTVENKISYSTSIGTIIKNNTLKAVVGSKANLSVTAIVGGRSDRLDENHGNKIFNNTIIGFSAGIEACNTDLEVYNNTITDCRTAIKIKDLTFSDIYDNTITSKIDRSIGITSHAASRFINEVNISNNTIDVDNDGINIIKQNLGEDYKNYSIYVNKNITTTGGVVSSSRGFYFKENTFNNRFYLKEASEGEISDNRIISDSYGVRIDAGCSNILIKENTITASKQCIWNNNSDTGNNIQSINNTCD